MSFDIQLLLKMIGLMLQFHAKCRGTLYLMAMLVTAVALVAYPVSVSVASSMHGLEQVHGHAERIGEVSASTAEGNTANMPCPGMPDCDMVFGSGPGHMIDVSSNGGECCAGFCLMAMGLAGAADIGPTIHPNGRFLRTPRVVPGGEWAAPLRPPNI